MTDSPAYLEKVYAGVLGKIIGVYLGRPFEGWLFNDIRRKFGSIETYVHEVMNVPLVVTDDDISGTFTFVRALEDHGFPKALTAEQIGRTWLNYIIENRSILWWGGFGASTEHTAYLRLRDGVPAPRSGSIELNGPVVAEQIGAQIFIDSWGLISPGDPARAVRFALQASLVSHDGEAIYGAQVIAAMVARAFVSTNIDDLIDTAAGLIPKDCLIARLIRDIRAWHEAEPDDWEANFHRIEANYGYDRYGGGCHIVPNHALIILALLHGRGHFQESLKIVNTCGWDTDCNSGNVGCILGVMGGLERLETGPDFRRPVADRMLIPQADGGRTVTDAVRESIALVNISRGLDPSEPIQPKQGARFHFSLPGSTQGFQAIEDHRNHGLLALTNAPLPGTSTRALAFRFRGLARGASVLGATPTWLQPADFKMPGYPLDACPTLYTGQTVTARVLADPGNREAVGANLALQTYSPDETLVQIDGPSSLLESGRETTLEWTLPETGGQPIATIGLSLGSDRRAEGTVYLDTLGWSGAPDFALNAPAGSKLWLKGWIRDTRTLDLGRDGSVNMIAWDRRGLAYTGTREWTDVRIAARIGCRIAESFGLLARVQGLMRHYLFELIDGTAVRILKMRDEATVLAEAPFPWKPESEYFLEFEVAGTRLRGRINGKTVIEGRDEHQPLNDGAAGLTVVNGRILAREIRFRPAGRD